MDYIHEIGKRAKAVSAQVQHLSQNQKNEGLRRVAEELENQLFKDVLASCETPYDADETGRTANLELAYNNAHAASKIAVAYSKL